MKGFDSGISNHKICILLLTQNFQQGHAFISAFHSGDVMIDNAMRAQEIATNRSGNGQNFERAFKMNGQNRRFIHTETGMMALTHPACRKGDIVSVLFSRRTPFIVRPTQNPHCYTFLGQCYLHGLMGGEAIK